MPGSVLDTVAESLCWALECFSRCVTVFVVMRNLRANLVQVLYFLISRWLRDMPCPGWPWSSAGANSAATASQLWVHPAMPQVLQEKAHGKVVHIYYY